MRLLSFLAFFSLAVAGCVAAASPSSGSGAPPQGSQQTPSGDTTSSSATRAPQFTQSELERALHRAVNRARRERGHRPLAWSDSLRRLARGHSRDMAQRGFFGHTTPGGATPTDRAQRLGFPATRPLEKGRRIGVGENLFRTYRYAGYRDKYRQHEGEPRRHVERVYDWKDQREVAEQTVESWLDSPPHRRALLSTDYRRHGLGVAITDERIYVTQNLF